VRRSRTAINLAYVLRMLARLPGLVLATLRSAAPGSKRVRR
jgi:hypothetical protein